MQLAILVCDDDRDIVSAIDIYLSGEGYKIWKAYDGEQALAIAAEQEIHLIVMDIMMPRMDGIEAMVKIREEKNIPILLLSAKGEDTDKVLGLNMGADDYIVKPFNAVELIARVKSQLRRYTRLGSMELPSDELCIGGIELNDTLKRVCVDGAEIALTPIEYRMLKLMMEHPDQVFSSAQLYAQVWNEPAFDVGKTVSVHIRHLREKIEIDPKNPRYIKVVYGVGYKLARNAR